MTNSGSERSAKRAGIIGAIVAGALVLGAIGWVEIDRRIKAARSDDASMARAIAKGDAFLMLYFCGDDDPHPRCNELVSAMVDRMLAAKGTPDREDCDAALRPPIIGRFPHRDVELRVRCAPEGNLGP